MSKKNLHPITGDIIPVFICYAVPSILGMLAMSCAVVVDGYFLGNYAGTASLASVNLTMPAGGILLGLALMFSVGGALRCGRYLGAGNLRAANGTFTQTIVFVSILSIVLTVLGIVFMDELVFFLGADEILAPAVAEYLNILLIFTIFQFGTICLCYFVRVAGLPFWALTAMIAGSVLNIVLDWLFVVSLQMGHEGAALGTGLAETATFFLLCRPFLSGRAKIRLYWRNRDIAEVAKAAVNGFPEFFNEFSLGVIMFVFNWIIMKSLGQAGIAAYSIINYMLLTGLIISYGVSEALQSIVCQNIGALKFKRIKTFLIISTVSVFAVGLIISLVLALNPNAISTLFMQSGSLKTIEMTNRYISIIWPIFIVNGVNVVLIAYLTALNRCFDSTIIILAKNLVLPALFLFIVYMVMDHDAILIVLPLAELATLFLGFFLLYKNRLGTVTNRKPVPIGSLFNPTAA